MANVKAGDLAFIVSKSKNCGRVVAVLRPYAGELIGGTDYVTVPGVAYWVVEACGSPLIVSRDFGPDVLDFNHVVRDSRLRPIRDPGENAVDEMVLIAGLPQEVTA